MGWLPLPGSEEPRTLGESLGAVNRRLGTARPDALATLAAQWTDLLGAELAGSCEIHSVRGDRLVVAASDPAVAEQVRWLEADLLGAANAVLGARRLGVLEVRVRPPR